MEASISQVKSNADPQVFLQVAQLHISKISGGFLAQLGSDFLAKMYRFIAIHHYLFVVVQEDAVIGFISGTVDSTTVTKRFILSLDLIALIKLVLACLRPTQMMRAFSVASYLMQKPPANLPKAELLSLAVSPNHTRRGIGAKLVTALNGALLEHDVTCYKIAAAETHSAALLFYKSTGAEEVATTFLSGVKTHLFIKTIRK